METQLVAWDAICVKRLAYVLDPTASMPDEPWCYSEYVNAKPVRKETVGCQPRRDLARL